ncbi:hypothetical protein [Nonomuraea sp. NPDC050643]|uniref:hypothetical protein n=1 Tax=Nonomuraea sp. NPDC050643 TaxID=3155660 RepID=UPI0033FD9D0C
MTRRFFGAVGGAEAGPVVIVFDGPLMPSRLLATTRKSYVKSFHRGVVRRAEVALVG